MPSLAPRGRWGSCSGYEYLAEVATGIGSPATTDSDRSAAVHQVEALHGDSASRKLLAVAMLQERIDLAADRVRAAQKAAKSGQRVAPAPIGASVLAQRASRASAPSKSRPHNDQLTAEIRALLTEEAVRVLVELRIAFGDLTEAGPLDQPAPKDRALILTEDAILARVQVGKTGGRPRKRSPTKPFNEVLEQLLRVLWRPKLKFTTVERGLQRLRAKLNPPKPS